MIQRPNNFIGVMLCKHSEDEENTMFLGIKDGFRITINFPGKDYPQSIKLSEEHLYISEGVVVEINSDKVIFAWESFF